MKQTGLPESDDSVVEADETSTLKASIRSKSSISTWMRRLPDFLLANLLPIGLVLSILIGAVVPAIGVSIDHPGTFYFCVIGIFLISGLYLKMAEVQEALQAYRALLWSFISILFISCVIGSKIASLVHFKTGRTYISPTRTWNNSTHNATVFPNTTLSIDNLQMGVQLYYIMPCTISSGVVMVAQLQGNEILALFITVVANIVAVFSVGPIFQWLIATGNTSVSLDIGSFLLKSTLQILLPLIVGKLLQFAQPVKKVTTAYKRVFKAVSVLLLVMIAFVKVSVASDQGLLKPICIRDIALVIGLSLLLHILLLVMNSVVSFVLRLPVEQLKCVAILASQKSMAVFVAVLSFLPEDVGSKGVLAVSVIIAHLSVILFDSVLISVWLFIERMRK